MARYSVRKVADLLAESDGAITDDEKGEKLEQLVKYLFEKVPGVSFVMKNALDGYRAHEIDLVFSVDVTASELHFLEFLLFIECKNTGQPLGSAGVGWFVRKLQDRGVHYGILVSLGGVTGKADGESNAHSEVTLAMARDKIRILLMNRAEIEALETTKDLASLLKNKLLQLTIYRTIA